MFTILKILQDLQIYTHLSSFFRNYTYSLLSFVSTQGYMNGIYVWKRKIEEGS